VVGDGSIDTKCKPSEPPEVGYNQENNNAEYDAFGLLLQTPSGEDEVVKNVGGHQDGKV
jgi:hypothetical protein